MYGEEAGDVQPPVESADSDDPPPMVVEYLLRFILFTSDQFVPFHSTVHVQKELFGAYLPPNIKAAFLF